MSEFIAARTGAYRHHPDLKYKKVFSDGEGGTRAFTVLYAGARDAGIIGPEDNGIVILDDDNLQVVLDKHLQTTSGYFGPSGEHMAEIQRIMAMEWAEFAGFCKANPRYRGSVPDFEGPADRPAYRRQDPRDIEPLLDAATLAKYAESKYAEPIGNPTLGTAKEFLRKHDFHRDGPYGAFRLSWNIKVGSFDSSGTASPESYPVNRHLDDVWADMVQRDQSLFDGACSDALGQYLGGNYSTYTGDDQGRYGFAVEGRSGGHLVLTTIDGHEYSWEDGLSDLNEFLEEAGRDEIAALYILSCHLDSDLSHAAIHEELAYQYSFQRNSAEDSGSVYAEAAEKFEGEGHRIGTLDFAGSDMAIDLTTGVLLDPPAGRPQALREVGLVQLSGLTFVGNEGCEPSGDQLECLNFNKEPLVVAVQAEAEAARDR